MKRRALFFGLLSFGLVLTSLAFGGQSASGTTASRAQGWVATHITPQYFEYQHVLPVGNGDAYVWPSAPNVPSVAEINLSTGQAVNAFIPIGLYGVYDLALDGQGHLLVAFGRTSTYGGGGVERFDALTGAVSGGFSIPTGYEYVSMAVDPASQVLYLANNLQGGPEISKFSLVDGSAISGFDASGDGIGPIQRAAVGPNGALYVDVAHANGAGRAASPVFELDPTTGAVVNTFSSSAISAYVPFEMAVDNSGHLFMTDSDEMDPATPHGTVYELDASTGAIMPGLDTLASSLLISPTNIATDSSGDVLVYDSYNGLYEFSPALSPAAPTAVSAQQGDSQATVFWQPPTDNGGAPITSFTATSAPGGKSCTAAATATSCTVPGLTDGTPYTFTVTAKNSVGIGDPSDASSPVTPILTPPVKVAGPTLSGTHVVGGTLTCTISYNKGATVFYKWLRNGSLITWGTGTYHPTITDYAHGVSCQSFARNGAGDSVTSTSAALYIEPGTLKDTVRPTMTGSRKVGYTLYAHVGTWTPTPTTYTYEWVLNGRAIRGGVHSSLKLTSSTRGGHIYLIVTVSKVGYASTHAESLTYTVAST